MNVQLSDYQLAMGLNDQVLFGGHTSAEDLDNLNKALQAGSITGRDTTNLTTASGAPLKVESLEKTLKVLTYNQQDVTFWKNIPKAPAFNTVEEYNQLSSYGADRGGFYNEGELPNTEDSTYVRRAQLVKFLGVTKEVTHPMTLVNTMIGSAIEREITNGTLWILRKLDKALYFGNSSIVTQEFDGILTQHANNDQFASLDAYLGSNVVVDLRGQPLGEKYIENAANGIIENFGLGTDLYAPPRVLSDFVKNFYGNKFIQPNTPALTNGVMGQRVKSFESQFGNINLNYDIFMNPAPAKTTASAATSANAPTAPLADGSNPTTAQTGIANSYFVNPNAQGVTDAGNYVYGVSAINRYGESVVTSLGAAATVAAGGAIDLKFTLPASTFTATGAIIYRSLKGQVTGATTVLYPIFTINPTQLAAGYDGAAALSVRDRNVYIPNTYKAMLVQHNTEVIEFKQLAPLMKMDLAVIAPSFRFMVLLYGTPFLYAPLKLVQFINIGLAA